MNGDALREVGFLDRFRLLMGLRVKLVLRAIGRSPGKAVAAAILFTAMLLWAVAIGVGVYFTARNLPDHTLELTHAVFLGLLVAQVSLGVVALAVSEFFDVSRILHLPLGYREVFAAMVTSGLFAPITLIYLAPAIALMLVLGGGLWLMLARLGLLVFAMMLGHAIALLLNLVFLTLLSRRRLRDLATIFASLIGVTFYVVFRSLGAPGKRMLSIIEFVPVEVARWLPSGWIAEVFHGRVSVPAASGYVGLVIVVTTVVLFAGARALRAAFLGHMPSPPVEAFKSGLSKRAWLPADLSAMVRSARLIYFREPQVKALYIQQTVFILAPIIMLQMETDQPRSAVLWSFMIPFVLPLSHMVFFRSLFGLDGRGITQLLLTPVPRWRILLARGIAVGGFFLLADFVITVLALTVIGFLKGRGFAPLATLPGTYFVVALVDVMMLAFGTVTSVLWPLRVGSQGRRALQGQRSEDSGIGSTMLRALLFIPSLLFATGVGLFALLPVLDWGLFGLELPRSAIWITVPLATLLALALYATAVAFMGEQLQRREEKLVRALTDSGE